jgi:hypothetical protein
MSQGPDPEYLVRTFPAVPSDGQVDADPIPVEDVERSFGSLRARGDHISVWDGGKIPPFRYTGDNVGQGRAVIHIQGVQRLQDGRHYVISGGDTLQDVSHVFVLRVGSAGTNAPFGSNVRDSREPPAEDKVVNILGLRNKHWHAGGIAVLGDVLAVPVEAGNRPTSGGGEPRARVLFLHLRDPMRPEVFPDTAAIDCLTPKAGAAALTRLPNGHFLCAVWSDAGGIELYLSRSAGTFTGFGRDRQWDCEPWRYKDALGGRKAPRYQSLGFVWQAGGTADPAPHLYLIGTGNTSPNTAPAIGGTDYADLFRVDLPAPMLTDPPEAPAAKFPAPIITRIRERKFDGGGEHCNMAAGGGVYVAPTGVLCAYGAYHWRLSRLFRLSEFRSDLLRLPDDRHGWVDLFEHDGFRGRRLSVFNGQPASIPDYTKLNVQGNNLDDAVSSARWQLPPGRTYRIYREKRFRLSGNNRDYIDLEGTGRIEQIANFAKRKATFGDCVSSSRFL